MLTQGSTDRLLEADVRIIDIVCPDGLHVILQSNFLPVLCAQLQFQSYASYASYGLLNCEIEIQ